VTRGSLALLNTTILVIAGGMLAGHVLWPFTPVASAARRWSFVLLMMLLGALRGARHAQLAGVSCGRRLLGAALLGAGLVLALAIAAWWLVHRPV
jgi:hypothetical protein